MADIPPEAERFGWGPGDLKWYHPPNGTPLFTTEELDKILADNPTVTKSRDEGDLVEEEPTDDDDLEAEKQRDAEEEARNAEDAEFKEEEHKRGPGGKFAHNAEAKDPEVRDVRTSLPVMPSHELRKVYNVANREADKRGELGKRATAYPVENVPISSIVASQPGLNSILVNKYIDAPPSGNATGVMHQDKYYLGDGHHRVEAALRRGDTHVPMHVQRTGKHLRQAPAHDQALVPLDPDLLQLAENANGQANVIQEIYDIQAERNATRWSSPTWE